ncbi:MAG: helix-turn-helix domain-containing protein [Chitinophagaceae bacterium]|nr:helix-turn-helix domain-containing protein [Chitinophagaceae bacterium]
MQFTFNIYSSLLLIFFVHGLVYSLLCWRKMAATGHRSFGWLALYLLMSILYIAPWMLGFAGWYDNEPYKTILLYTPTRLSWGMGPVMFFYIQSLLNPGFRFGKKEALHLLPLAVYLLGHVGIWLHDIVLQQQPALLAAGIDPDFIDLTQVPGTLLLLGYFGLSLRYYLLYRRLMVQVVSFADVLLFRWVRNFLAAFLAFLVSTILLELLGWVFDLWYSDTWWYYLVFALIFYYIAIAGYANQVEPRIAFMPHLLANRTTLLLSAPGIQGEAPDHPPQYLEVEVVPATPAAGPDPELQAWKNRILEAVVGRHLYEDPDLTLVQLAQQLATNPSQLSKAINQGFGKNFNDFINQYRVESLLEKLRRGEHRQQTLLALAYDAGFNSKATFNRAFQRHTGHSPSEWLKKEQLL